MISTLKLFHSKANKTLVSTLLCLGFPMASLANADTINVLNIQWQPYYYKDHKQISGYAKDIVAKVLQRAGVQANFGFKDWDVVYQEGLEKPNTVIAGVGRINSREDLFHWIGPINKQQTIYAYGLKNHKTNISSIDDIDSYLTAVERNMYYHDFMIKMGFEEQTYPVSDVSSLIKLLMVGRVDFILLEKERMEVEFTRLGYDLDEIEAKALAFSAQSYMTLSRSSDAQLADKLKQSYLDLQQSGEIVLH